MSQIRQFFPVVAILFGSCAFTQTAKLTAEYPKETAQIRHCLNEPFDAAEKKDLNRPDGYHFYRPKLTGSDLRGQAI
jgi:hypothetical protein